MNALLLVNLIKYFQSTHNYEEYVVIKLFIQIANRTVIIN